MLHLHGRGGCFWAEWLSPCHACFPICKDATSLLQFLLGRGDHEAEMKQGSSIQPRASPSHPLTFPTVAGSPKCMFPFTKMHTVAAGGPNYAS